MKVRTRLIIVFLLMVSFVWALALLAENTYTNIHEEFQLLREDIVPGTIAMGQIDVKANEAAHELMDYVIQGDQESKQLALSATEELKKVGLEHLEHAAYLGQEEQEAAEELMVKIDRFTLTVVELVNLKRQGVSVDELLTRKDQEAHPALATLLEQVREHEAAHMEELTQAEDAVSEARASGEQLLFVTAILSTLFGGAAVFLISRSIVNPLRTLHKGTEVIAQGNLDYKVGTNAKDEIGQLSRAFDRMTEDLGRTTTSVDNLNEEITEHKKAEEELKKTTARHQFLMDSSVDAIWFSVFEEPVDITLPEAEIIRLMNEREIIIEANDALAKMYGFEEASQLVGKRWMELVSPGDNLTHSLELVRSHYKIDRRVRTGKDLRGNITYYEDSEGGNIVDNKLVSFFGLRRDISERKKAEEEREVLLENLKVINSKLEQSNKELQDFAYVASHDLQEPLRKITSFGTLLQDSLEGKLDEDQQENLGFMVSGGKRMQAMIDDLLTYSRITTRAKSFEQVDLNEVIEDLKSLELATLLDETGGCIHVPEPLLPVWGDPSQVHQLLQNLVGNGLKFHREKIPPEITARTHQTGGNMVRVEVQDNGIGIAEEYHEQVFTMFKRLHSRERYKGTGIGLAVCKKVVERHGGDIGIKSTPGEGSTFWFTLRRGRSRKN